jgi:hypothetical protein
MVEANATLDVILPLFEKYETEALVVIDNLQSRLVLGCLTEAFALRRYRQELERRQREMVGLTHPGCVRRLKSRRAPRATSTIWSKGDGTPRWVRHCRPRAEATPIVPRTTLWALPWAWRPRPGLLNHYISMD